MKFYFNARPRVRGLENAEKRRDQLVLLVHLKNRRQIIFFLAQLRERISQTEWVSALLREIERRYSDAGVKITPEKTLVGMMR